MNLQSRLDKLETKVNPPQAETHQERSARLHREWVYMHLSCEHDGIKVDWCTPYLTREWRDDDEFIQRWDPKRNYLKPDHNIFRDKRFEKVTHVHCHKCGFQTPLWDVSRLSQEQWDRVCRAYADGPIKGEWHNYKLLTTELIEAGHLDFVPWPTSRPVPNEYHLWPAVRITK